MLNGAAYLAYGVLTGRLRERLLPIRLADIAGTLPDTLRLHVAHGDLTTCNAVQKLLYIAVILAAASQVATGLAIWHPVQFQGPTALLGGFQAAQVIRFLGMSAIVGFLVALSLLLPQTLWAMLTGGPRLPPPHARQHLPSLGARPIRSPFRPARAPTRVCSKRTAR